MEIHKKAAVGLDLTGDSYERKRRSEFGLFADEIFGEIVRKITHTQNRKRFFQALKSEIGRKYGW